MLKKLALAALLFLFVSTWASAQTTHSVALIWNSSTDTAATYDVWRAQATCPQLITAMTKVNTTPIPAGTLTFTDTSSVLTSGTTFCYGVTAVDQGIESGFNGQLQVQIPMTVAVVTPQAPPPPNGLHTTDAQ